MLREPNPRLLGLALCAGYFLVLLDVTVVNVALPSIGAGLRASPAGLAWIVDAYTVPLAALLLAAGAIGDALGHRRVVPAGFAGFGLASILCASAPALPVLVAGRVLQGVAAALMLPGTLALLTDSAPTDRARTRAVALWAAVGACALPAGPFLGGLLTQYLGWQAVFWLNVPIIATALLALTPTAGRGVGSGRGVRVDWAGAGVLVVVVGAAVTAIIEGPGDPLLGAAAGVVAVLGGVLLRRVERRAARPLLTVPRAARGPLTAACVVAGVMNLCSLGSLFLLTQYLQDVRQTGPLATGLLLLPAMLPLPLLGAAAGRLTHRLGPWPTAALGLVAGAAGFTVLALTVRGTGHLPLLAGFALWGTGLGLLTPAVVAAAIQALPGARGTASGASNTARQIGAALGVAVFGVLAGPSTQPAFTARTTWIFAACALLFLLAAGYARRPAHRSGRLVAERA